MKAFFEIKIGSTTKLFSINTITYTQKSLLTIIDETSLVGTKQEISVDYDFENKIFIKNDSRTTNELKLLYDEFEHVAEIYLEKIKEIQETILKLSDFIKIQDNIKCLQVNKASFKIQMQTLSYHLLASDFYDLPSNISDYNYVVLKDFAKSLDEKGNFKLVFE